MFIRILDWIGERTPRESVLLCLLISTGFYAAIFHACLGA